MLEGISGVCITFKCIDGGHGWGETGNTTIIRFPLSQSFETDAWYLTHAPGGWIIEHKEYVYD